MTVKDQEALKVDAVRPDDDGLYRLNFAVAPDAAWTPMQHPTYGYQCRELPLVVGELTPWHEFFYGWPLRLVRRENDGKTLVMEVVRPDLTASTAS